MIIRVTFSGYRGEQTSNFNSFEINTIKNYKKMLMQLVLKGDTTSVKKWNARICDFGLHLNLQLS